MLIPSKVSLITRLGALTHDNPYTCHDARSHSRESRLEFLFLIAPIVVSDEHFVATITECQPLGMLIGVARKPNAHGVFDKLVHRILTAWRRHDLKERLSVNGFLLLVEKPRRTHSQRQAKA